MGNTQDLLLGELAVSAGWIGPQQLNQCMAIQERLQVPKPLGIILLEQGVINQAQLDALLIQVREKQAFQDSHFIMVAQALGMLEPEEIQTVQQLKAQEPEKELSTILVEKGYLTPAQLQRVIENFNISRILGCSKCGRQFNITPYEEGREYSCPHCAELLVPYENVALPLNSPGMQPPGMQPPGMQPPGMQPPGMQPPGMQPPGMQPPGMQPPGMQPPGMQPPGMQPPGMQPPGMQPSTMPDLAAGLLQSALGGGPSLLDDLNTPTAESSTPSGSIRLSGVARGLDLRIPEEEVDELCGKRFSDYLILKRIGAGAMGEVYKAEQIRLRRVVALKLLSKELCNDRFYIQRFLIEARSAAKLNHPNVLQIYDTGSWEGRFFFSMEFVQGESINDVLQRMGKIPAAKALNIVYQIAQALVEAHEHGVVHRDIKPENIMLSINGIAKLADLGLAKNIDYAKEMEAMESGLVLGTPYYISPEQIDSSLTVDSRADIYSLGVTFFRMVTGQIPFYDKDPRGIMKKVKQVQLPPVSQVEPSVPKAMDFLIQKMIKKKPEERYQTPQELVDAIDELKDKIANYETRKISKTPALRAEKMMKIEVKERIDTGSLEFQEQDQETEKPVLSVAPIQPPVTSTPRPGSRSQPRSSSTLPLLIVLAVVAAVGAFLLWQPAKTRRPRRNSSRPGHSRHDQHPVMTAAQKRKAAYQAYLKRLRDFEKNLSNLEQGENLINEVYTEFVLLYEGTPEAADLNRRRLALRKEIEQRRILNDYQRKSQKISSLIKRQAFRDALTRWQELAKQIKFQQLRAQIDSLGRQIRKQARQVYQQNLALVRRLVARGRFQEAIRKLKQANDQQIPALVSDLQQQIAKIQHCQKREREIKLRMNIEHQLLSPLRRPLAPKDETYSTVKQKLILRQSRKCSPSCRQIIDQYIDEVDLLKKLESDFIGVLRKEWLRKEKKFHFKGQQAFMGRLFSISSNGKIAYIMIGKNKVANFPLQEIVWEIKRAILFVRHDPQQTATHQELATYCLLKGMTGAAKQEIEALPASLQPPFRERLLRLKLFALLNAIKAQDVHRIRTFFELLTSQERQLDSYRLYQSQLAHALFRLAQKIRSKCAAEAQDLEKLIVQEFPLSLEAEKIRQSHN